MKSRPRATKAKTDSTQPAPLTEEAAAQAMWLFYRDHKLQLITDIRDCRASILAQIMAGVSLEAVFAPYFKPEEPARSKRSAN